MGWAKRVETQRGLSAIMYSLTKTKEFDKIKIVKGNLNTMGEMCKHVPKCPQRGAAFIAAPAIHKDNAQPMGRIAWTAVRSITSERYVEAGEAQWSIA